MGFCVTITLPDHYKAPPLANEKDLMGCGSLINRETIEIQEQRIQFNGIDTLESRKICGQAEQEYSCEQMASIGVHYSSNQNLKRWIAGSCWELAFCRCSKGYVRDEDFAREGKAAFGPEHLKCHLIGEGNFNYSATSQVSCWRDKF